MIPKGAKVRIPENELAGFLVAFQKRVKGRIGVVTGHTHEYKVPLVTFPADGRKKEFGPEQIRERWLEVVDLPNDSEAS